MTREPWSTIPSTEQTAQLLPAISYGSNEVEAVFPTPLARMPRYNSILTELIKERVITRVLAKSWLVKHMQHIASKFSPRRSNCGCWVYKEVVTVVEKGRDTSSVCSHSLTKQWIVLDVANAVVLGLTNLLDSSGTSHGFVERVVTLPRSWHARWTKVVALLDIANVGLGNASPPKFVRNQACCSNLSTRVIAVLQWSFHKSMTASLPATVVYHCYYSGCLLCLFPLRGCKCSWWFCYSTSDYSHRPIKHTDYTPTYSSKAWADWKGVVVIGVCYLRSATIRA